MYIASSVSCSFFSRFLRIVAIVSIWMRRRFFTLFPHRSCSLALYLSLKFSIISSPTDRLVIDSIHIVGCQEIAVACNSARIFSLNDEAHRILSSLYVGNRTKHPQIHQCSWFSPSDYHYENEN